MNLRTIGIVFALSFFSGCVSNDDELVVVDVGHEESKSSSFSQYPNVEPASDALEGDESTAMIDPSDEIEEAPNAELTDSDVIPENSRLKDKTKPKAPEKAYVHGSNTVDSQPLPRQLPAARNSKPIAQVLYVKTNTLNVRKTPQTNGVVVKKLGRGQRVIASARHGQWVKIGEDQYVLGSHLSSSAPIIPAAAWK